jgi:hypothetical protein
MKRKKNVLSNTFLSLEIVIIYKSTGIINFCILIKIKVDLYAPYLDIFFSQKIVFYQLDEDD